MAGARGRSGGARLGAGRKVGSQTDRAAMAEKSALFQLERQLAKPAAEQDRKAIRELVAALRILHRHRRYYGPPVAEEPERPHVVVMAPPPMSAAEWQAAYCAAPADEPPANAELAQRMEAVAAPPKQPKTKDVDNDQPPRYLPPVIGPLGFPVVGPGPAELDLGAFIRERTQGRVRLN
jgi:hypothetical protein